MNHKTCWLLPSFLPSLYFCFATFKVQFNGNVLSGWKKSFLYYYVAMYIWNRMLDGNGNISHTFCLWLCQKCQPFLLCQITRGRMQLQREERRGTKPLQWALGSSQLGKVGFWPQLKSGLCFLGLVKLRALQSGEKKQLNAKPWS